MAKKRHGPPPDVKAIRKEIEKFMNTEGAGRVKIGNFECAVYAFYDYDDEPIYVGQTYEGIRGRIGRHLTGQRSDPVAKSVLDFLEVAKIRVWPLPELQGKRPRKDGKKTSLPKEHRQRLDDLEFTVYQKAIKEARFGAVLNEDVPKSTLIVELSQPYSQTIIPEELIPRLSHPGTRIARRALTIANLAKVINERSVSFGLRRVLVTQAKRLGSLASQRLSEWKKENASPKEEENG